MKTPPISCGAPTIGGEVNQFYNTLAASIVSNGYTVTPTKGKKPFLSGWQNPKQTDQRWLVKQLTKGGYPDCNLGIVCGRVVGIDIDAEDPAKVELLKALAAKHLGSTPFERIGRAPRTLLLYQPATGAIIPSVKFDCIEVLSGGRQFVAFGVHPNTGKPYEWIDPSPVTARLDELPIVTQASVQAFADAVCTALGTPVNGLPPLRPSSVDVALRSRQRARQAEMLGGPLNTRIVRDVNGWVIDGREAFMASLTAAEFAKRTHGSPDDLGRRVWSQFVEAADVSRPKGSNPRQRWSLKDALSKAYSTCRRNPGLKPPRRSRGGHQASYLHSWRRPGFWKFKEREWHLAEVGRRIAAPATLAVARIMIEAVNLADGFCTMSIAKIAGAVGCSTTTVKAARKTLVESGLWIASGGVFVPCPNGRTDGLNRAQLAEKRTKRQSTGHSKVPSLYHLVGDASLRATTIWLRSYQADMFGAPVVDLAVERSYRRGLLPTDVAVLVRAEMRARGLTQEELAAALGISQPQLANALAGRFGLSPDPAARLVAWLREAA